MEMEKSTLKTALHYLTKGYSVIPIKRNKKPFVPWIEYQQKKPTENEVREWWDKWPSANVAIVTGKISNVCAVDIDESGGFEAIQGYIPDTLIIPTCKTPGGGQHLYFQFPDKPLNNNIRVIPGCDFRGEGGYIIAPPSTNGRDKVYNWLDNLSLDDTDPPAMPSELFNVLRTYSYSKTLDNFLDKNEKPQYFQQGRRDEDLFHIANCLVKVQCCLGMSSQVLQMLAAQCNPPFSPEVALDKVKSALARAQRQERNLSAEIREYVLSSPGLVMSRDVQVCLGLSSREGQKLVWYMLNEMVKEGLVERVQERHGCYRMIDRECEKIDYVNAPEQTVNISLPFEIEKKVEIMPGNIIVIAGEINAGKTAFLLNVIRDNMEKFEIHYFSSEMGGGELKKRLKKFDYPLSLSGWKFDANEKADNFGDVIVSGEGNINIVDYLEIHTNFYEVSKHLAEVHKKLKGAVAIVALQKNPGTDVGLGGYRGMEKPRLYLSMGKGRLKIVKAKNWVTANNPNGLEVKFKIVDGCKLIKASNWYLADSGE